MPSKPPQPGRNEESDPSLLREETSRLLRTVCSGDPGAEERLMQVVYDQLRALAASRLRAERREHTLQPTDLVHEAYVRMVQGTEVDWKGRTHFFACAASMMRRVLVDHARARQAKKRGENPGRVALEPAGDGVRASSEAEEVDILALDEALCKLARISARQSQMIELRFFGGMPVEEVARHLGVSERTVRNEWRVARAWLLDQMGGPPSS